MKKPSQCEWSTWSEKNSNIEEFCLLTIFKCTLFLLFNTGAFSSTHRKLWEVSENEDKM